jgi:hypothetical protein
MIRRSAIVHNPANGGGHPEADIESAGSAARAVEATIAAAARPASVQTVRMRRRF